MTLDAHDDGWVTLPGADGTTVHVRAQRSGYRVMVTDIYLHSSDGIRPTTVRGLSISRLEAELTLATSPRHPVSSSQMPTLTAVFDAAWAQSDATPEPTLAQLRSRAPLAPANDPPPRARLGRPGTKGPDEFYACVAQAYAEYAAKTSKASKAIADEAGVPVTMAQRWVREARRRGFLPAARAGRAG